MASCTICRKRRAVHRHHLVKQQRIRNRWRTLRYRAGGESPYPLTRALNDPRLWIMVCGFDGCHVEETPVPIPDGFWEAVDEYGLAPELPRWLAETYVERTRPRPSSYLEDYYTNTVEDAAEFQRMRELP